MRDRAGLGQALSAFHPMPYALRPRRSHLVAFCSLACAATASAQFSPYGSTTISTPTTAAQTLAAGTGTITSAGSITVSTTAVALTMSGNGTTLDNFGAIINNNAGASGNPRGILADGTGLVLTNEAGGLIQSYGNDAVRSSNAGTSIRLTNYGTIAASNNTTTNPQQAVDWNSITTGANRVDNYGTIQAVGNDAVRPGVNGFVYNYANATIQSANNASGTSSDGIDAQANTGVTVVNSGAITGGRHGITGGNTTGANGGAFTLSITNNAGATITGSNGGGLNIDGTNGQEVVTMNNAGTITGNGSALNGTNTAQDGDAVDVDGLVNLTNTGTIQSLNSINDASEGITVGGGTIINSGTILGAVNGTNNGTGTGKGITILGIDNAGTNIAAMYGNTVITNSGSIRGTSNSGITIGYSNAAGVTVVPSGFTSTINNLAGGIIEGGGTTITVGNTTFVIAAIQTGVDNDTVNNSGTITADSSGLAVDLGGGNNALNVTGGVAAINGNVSGGVGGTNSLTITPGAGNTFSYAGSFSNFATVGIGVAQTGADGRTNFSGGRVVLSGASTYTGTTTIYNGATLVANTPFAAGSATGSGVVSVLQGGTLAGTGNVAGDVTLAARAVLSPGDGGAGTLTVGGNLNTVGGSTFTYDVGDTQLRTDRLTLTGTLAFSGQGQMVFNIVGNGLGTGTYDLIDFGGASGFDASNLTFGAVPAGFAGNFTLTGTSLLLNVTAVPEPGAAAWIGAAALLTFAATVLRRRVAG